MYCTYTCNIFRVYVQYVRRMREIYHTYTSNILHVYVKYITRIREMLECVSLSCVPVARTSPGVVQRMSASSKVYAHEQRLVHQGVSRPKLRL